MFDGEYDCFSYDEESGKRNSPDKIVYNGSVVNIKYKEECVLEIVCTDKFGNIWNGNAIMESADVGIMAWYYVKLSTNGDDSWKRNGIKRLAVIENIKNKLVKICLFSEEDDSRFGREILMKKQN